VRNRRETTQGEPRPSHLVQRSPSRLGYCCWRPVHIHGRCVSHDAIHETGCSVNDDDITTSQRLILSQNPHPHLLPFRYIPPCSPVNVDLSRPAVPDRESWMTRGPPLLGCASFFLLFGRSY
jgi:hypothetical protein